MVQVVTERGYSVGRILDANGNVTGRMAPVNGATLPTRAALLAYETNLRRAGYVPVNLIDGRTVR